jgi:hypothetical protein
MVQTYQKIDPATGRGVLVIFASGVGTPDGPDRPMTAEVVTDSTVARSVVPTARVAVRFNTEGRAVVRPVRRDRVDDHLLRRSGVSNSRPCTWPAARGSAAGWSGIAQGSINARSSPIPNASPDHRCGSSPQESGSFRATGA